MTASRRINSHMDLNRIDETRGNITVEEGDVLVNERNIDRQTYANHSCIQKLSKFYLIFVCQILKAIYKSAPNFMKFFEKA